MKKLTVALFVVSIYASGITGFFAAYMYLKHDFNNMAVPIMTVGELKEFNK